MNKNTEKSAITELKLKFREKAKKKVEEKDREIGGEKLGRHRKKRRKNNFDKESTLNNIQREG